MWNRLCLSTVSGMDSGVQETDRIGPSRRHLVCNLLSLLKEALVAPAIQIIRGNQATEITNRGLEDAYSVVCLGLAEVYLGGEINAFFDDVLATTGKLGCNSDGRQSIAP